MNKSELASKIWESANKMRSKIEASEYKDYILGLIFYKFLSEKEERFLKQNGATIEEFKNFEEGTDEVEGIRNGCGYYISYNNLFSTWLSKKTDFEVGDVLDGLSAFNRLINPRFNKVFSGIFNSLETGISKLGNDSRSQSKAIRELCDLIKDIPMDEKSFDVLGYIYEYLIAKFASSSGKKAGEFYTPHEVSLVMSEIISEHLKDRSEIKIYDPTSGSGSLLINIGQCIGKHIHNKDKITYYAQEIKENTYNLTRMNLVMRGIEPDNIVARCGDTLEDDWPFFDDNDKEKTINILTNIDAVVSNPPYSLPWNPTSKKSDPRFKEYGLAPQGKADFAFLLHNLYHLDKDGIMTIVLPHGVLFRGAGEGEIRKNLIENNNIDAIIGLPANIFYGTSIPTIIMVLKKRRTRDDILFIDASKGFEKGKKQNNLRSQDIRKIVDTYNERIEVAKYSRIVSRAEVRKNDYNLNIPRYVDSSDQNETYDLNALLTGGIPKSELFSTCKELTFFKTLYSELFTEGTHNLVSLKSSDVGAIINANNEVLEYKEKFKRTFGNFKTYLDNSLIQNKETANIYSIKDEITDYLFKKSKDFAFLDKYEVYQIFDNHFKVISSDLEIIQSDTNYKEQIISIPLIQSVFFKDVFDEKEILENNLKSYESEIKELFDGISDEDKEGASFVNKKGDNFSFDGVKSFLKSYSKEELSSLEEGSLEDTLLKAQDLNEKNKTLKKDIKSKFGTVDKDAEKMLANLSNNEINSLLLEKWIAPLLKEIDSLPEKIFKNLEKKINILSKKYGNTLESIDKSIKETSSSLISMLDELEGTDDDLFALNDLKRLLGE